MKKKIFGVALIVTMTVATGWNFNQNNNEMKLSDLTLANIKALANNEGSGEKLYEGYCPGSGTQCRASAVTGPTCSPKRSCP